MKFTVLVNDQTAYINNVPLVVEMSQVPTGVHALQFDTDRSTGWIEFVENSDYQRPDNLNITELPSWATDIIKRYQWKQLAGETYN
jgi:hypothetical protein